MLKMLVSSEQGMHRAACWNMSFTHTHTKKRISITLFWRQWQKNKIMFQPGTSSAIESRRRQQGVWLGGALSQLGHFVWYETSTVFWYGKRQGVFLSPYYPYFCFTSYQHWWCQPKSRTINNTFKDQHSLIRVLGRTSCVDKTVWLHFELN